MAQAQARPLGSRYSERDWQQELGRELTADDRRRLATPHGEAVMIAEMADLGGPITMYSPYIPGDRTRTNWFYDLPVWEAAGEQVHYTIQMSGVYFDIRGRWFDGNGQFVVYEGRWRLAGEGWSLGHPVTRLKLKILATAIEMRASAIISQTAWFAQIAKMDDADRYAALVELLAEADNFLLVEIGRDGSSINFRGLAGLGAYHFDTHRDDDTLVVDRVYQPARIARKLHAPYREIPGTRRRPLQARWKRDRAIMELVRMAVAGHTATVRQAAMAAR